MLHGKNLMEVVIIAVLAAGIYGQDSLPELPLPLPLQNQAENEVAPRSRENGNAIPDRPYSRSALKTSGIITTAISHGFAATTSIILTFSDYETDHRVAGVLWIPFAGPIAADVVDGADDPGETLMCTMWSAAEVVGVIFVAAGRMRERNEQKRFSVRVQPDLRNHGVPGMVCKVTF